MTQPQPFVSIRVRPGTFAAATVGLTLLASQVGAQMLYWTAVDEDTRYKIRRSHLDGSGIEDLAPDIDDSLAGLAVDPGAGTLYWVERGATEYRIVRADLDGAGSKVVHRTESPVARLSLDPAGKMIYFTTYSFPGAAGIWRVPYAGGEATSVVPGDIDDLAVDGAGGMIYWVREGEPGTYGTDIWRAALDGQGAKPIIHHAFEHHTTGIALDTLHGKIYWATVDYRETHAQIVKRANLDGSEVEPVTTADPGLDDWPVFLDVDLEQDKLYWVNGEDGVFYRVELGGGEAEELHEDPGPYGPFDMVIVPSRETPPQFRRGDADGGGTLDLTDAVLTLNVLFLGTGALSCRDAADVNDDGVINITDSIAALTFLFLGGFEIPPPGHISCGPDTTAPGSLGCEAYACSS